MKAKGLQKVSKQHVRQVLGLMQFKPMTQSSIPAKDFRKATRLYLQRSVHRVLLRA